DETGAIAAEPNFAQLALPAVKSQSRCPHPAAAGPRSGWRDSCLDIVTHRPDRQKLLATDNPKAAAAREDTVQLHSRPNRQMQARDSRWYARQTPAVPIHAYA